MESIVTIIKRERIITEQLRLFGKNNKCRSSVRKLYRSGCQKMSVISSYHRNLEDPEDWNEGDAGDLFPGNSKRQTE
jgi:hypothetical protein